MEETEEDEERRKDSSRYLTRQYKRDGPKYINVYGNYVN